MQAHGTLRGQDENFVEGTFRRGWGRSVGLGVLLLNHYF